mmetsp:Transcript_14940/g.34198  ORF Transcript_14940/g.34198 Transcript_14940/m.34198 type:complete len:369 (+) Transcript_14940:365-1471(+)
MLRATRRRGSGHLTSLDCRTQSTGLRPCGVAARATLSVRVFGAVARSRPRPTGGYRTGGRSTQLSTAKPRTLFGKSWSWLARCCARHRKSLWPSSIEPSARKLSASGCRRSRQSSKRSYDRRALRRAARASSSSCCRRSLHKCLDCSRKPRLARALLVNSLNKRSVRFARYRRSCCSRSRRRSPTPRCCRHLVLRPSAQQRPHKTAALVATYRRRNPSMRCQASPRHRKRPRKDIWHKARRRYAGTQPPRKHRRLRCLSILQASQLQHTRRCDQRHRRWPAASSRRRLPHRPLLHWGPRGTQGRQRTRNWFRRRRVEAGNARIVLSSTRRCLSLMGRQSNIRVSARYARVSLRYISPSDQQAPRLTIA